MVLLVALLGGVYLSGFLVKLLIGVDIPVDTKTWWTYFQALDTPRMQPYAAKVKWAGYIGFGVP
ncbi:type IV secretory system conjugative DNA transfer family protein, partial [Lysobacter pythonis]